MAAALAASATGLSMLAQGQLVLETQDRVAGRIGEFRGGSVFTPSGGGRTGQSGDHAVDFGMGTGPVHVADAAFLNAAAAEDRMTFALWAKKYDIAASSVFWANSPSSNNGQRGAQVHLPWSNNRIYFDTAGCCEVSQRIDESVEFFAEYTGDTTWWTDTWNHFVFVKNAEVKQIWINGQLFFEGYEAGPLPTDFVNLNIGSDGAGGGLYHGLVDDFAIFGSALTEAQIGQLYGGTAPSALPAAAGLLAFWDFNDVPAGGQFTRVTPAPGSTGAGPDLIEVVNLGSGTAWSESNVSLRLNGVAVTPTVTMDGSTATLRYVPSPLLDPLTTYTASITYPGAGGAPTTSDWEFTVGLYIKDQVASRVGTLQGGAQFTPGGQGRSGQAGDFAMNFPTAPAGSVRVGDATFLNGAGAEDTLTFSFWQRLHTVRNASAFWALSPSSPSSSRGFQAHSPWGDQTIYFDSAGCCDGDVTRINLNVNADTVSGYEDATWWQTWRHYVFVKNKEAKEIWIDGELFHSGWGDPLPSDFTSLILGGGPGVADNRMAGLMDDFAIFGVALNEAQIRALAQGSAPSALPGSPQVLAAWDFNDMPTGGIFGTILPAPGSQTAAPNLVQVTHVQGTAAWNLAQVSLRIDGAPVDASVQLEGGVVTVRYVPNPIFAARSTHTASLAYPGPDGQMLTRDWSFTVGAYTRDTIEGRIGLLTGPARFTEAGGGRTGQAGDLGIDLGMVNAQQSVHVLDASFLNAATAQDELAFAAWQKLYMISDSALFWASSPSSSGGGRGFSSHAPWSNNILYFDTAGCCDGTTQRINQGIDAFPDYSGEQTWWQEWRHIVFQKQGEVKQIWIDGELFLEGYNTSPLPTDFTQMWVGFNPADNATMRGVVDDFAVFRTALTPAHVAQLAGGTLPSALPAAAGLVAYWNFNDAPAEPVEGPKLTVTRVGNSLTVTSDPQPLPEGFVLETAPAVGGPWTVQTGATTPLTVTIGDSTTFLRAVRR
ncbi:MAG: hypothetical protein KF833_06870 [Verrucomicrobiae bacterium]|nr:hypothetical protein [Verrucomicrobiae bacterium]